MIETYLVQSAREEGEYRERSRMRKVLSQVFKRLLTLKVITHEDIEKEFKQLLKK